MIEPTARMDLGHADSVRIEPPREHEIELSKAISLRRIAGAAEAIELALRTLAEQANRDEGEKR